jgi:hypothetical protein
VKRASINQWDTTGPQRTTIAGVELPMPRLLLDDGTIVACLRRLDASRMVIGYDVSADLRLLEDPQISAIHAGIVWKEAIGLHVLYDYGSAGGTRLNGGRVRRPMPLVNGARIRVGATNLTYCCRLPIPGYVSTLARRFRAHNTVDGL